MTQARPTRFLIAGAGGRNGATGNHAARQLLARGLPVRAFVRQADDRADELRALGAEIAVGDLRNFEVVREALDVVQTIGAAPPKSLDAFIRENATVFGLPQDANRAHPASYRQAQLSDVVRNLSR